MGESEGGKSEGGRGVKERRRGGRGGREGRGEGKVRLSRDCVCF